VSIVNKYPAKVLKIQDPVDGIHSVEFESLDKRFKYESGQFLHLALDDCDPSENWPESRCFSIQSSPEEENIRITYSVKGLFTNRMQEELKSGMQVVLKLPYGDLFSQDHNKINTVFIAGGTGITPYLSLFTNASFNFYLKPVLYAGFRNENYNLYLNELELAKKINKGLEVQFVYENKDGLLDIEKIYLKSYKDSTFFISGPLEMIRLFKSYLLNQGISSVQIKTDDWE